MATYRQGLHDQSQPGRPPAEEVPVRHGWGGDPQGRRRRDPVTSPPRLEGVPGVGAVASDAFMADVEGLPVQERERW